MHESRRGKAGMLPADQTDNQTVELCSVYLVRPIDVNDLHLLFISTKTNLSSQSEYLHFCNASYMQCISSTSSICTSLPLRFTPFVRSSKFEVRTRPPWSESGADRCNVLSASVESCLLDPSLARAPASLLPVKFADPTAESRLPPVVRESDMPCLMCDCGRWKKEVLGSGKASGLLQQLYPLRKLVAFFAPVRLHTSWLGDFDELRSELLGWDHDGIDDRRIVIGTPHDTPPPAISLQVQLIDSPSQLATARQTQVAHPHLLGPRASPEPASRVLLVTCKLSHLCHLSHVLAVVPFHSIARLRCPHDHQLIVLYSVHAAKLCTYQH